MVDEEATTPSSAVSKEVLNPDFSRNYPDWSDEEILASDMLIQDMMDYYPDYSLPQGIKFKENNQGAFFYDRDNKDTPPGQPLIEVHPSRKITSMAHELGHDALVQSLPNTEGPRIVYSTFKELFADLNSLHFTDLEPENRDLNRDPNKDLSVYNGITDLLEPGHWEKQIMKVDKIMQSLEKGGWDTIQTNSKSLANSEPQAAPILDVRDFPYEKAGTKNYLEKLSDNPVTSHMFYDNFFGTRDYAPITDVSETTHDIWSMSQVLANTDIMPLKHPIKEARENRSRIWGKMAKAATTQDDYTLDDIEEKPEQILSQALETDLWDVRENMQEIRNNLETVGSPHYFVKNSISNQKYGKPYDTSIDYPHNIGGKLAEELYRTDTEPMDVIEEPEAYMQLSTEAINQHIENNL